MIYYKTSIGAEKRAKKACLYTGLKWWPVLRQETGIGTHEFVVPGSVGEIVSAQIAIELGEMEVWLIVAQLLSPYCNTGVTKATP